MVNLAGRDHDGNAYAIAAVVTCTVVVLTAESASREET